MSKKGRSMRGLRYEDAARDQATRFRMITDEIIEHDQPDQIKLRNGGGHRYQRRHLELIVYRTQMAKEFVPAWRAPRWDHGSNTVAILAGDYLDGSAYKEVRPFEIAEGLRDWVGSMNDPHLGIERSPSTIIASKHLSADPMFQPKYSKADIQWPGSDADVFMEALGHYAHTRLNPFPQLHLSDLADPAKPIEDRLVELGTQQMQQWAQRSRMGGKSISMTDAFVHSYAMTRWFEENLRFKLLPHQHAVVEQASKQRPHLPFA
jgi:hypothetical protein